MSFDYENSKIQILTADSQASYKNGVVTLVTGLLTVKEGERMRFSQSFFLVPQNGSYFVLNDVFRYVADEFVEPEAYKKEVEEVIPQVVQSTVTATLGETGEYWLMFSLSIKISDLHFGFHKNIDFDQQSQRKKLQSQLLSLVNNLRQNRQLRI